MTEELLTKFKNILVTGGAGFIGNNFIRKVIKTKKNKIFNIDKISYCSNKYSLQEFEQNFPNNYEFYQINLIDFDKIRDVVQKVQPDLIIHFAAESHVDKSIKTPFEFIQSNILGTFNLLEATREYWTSLSSDKKEKFILLHISTDEVYGTLEDSGHFSEKSQYKPNSPYSASKAAGDHLVRSWFKTYELPTIVTNCSNNYGPWQFTEKLIPMTIKKILDKKKIPVYGDGKQRRDWLYVEDHIEALIKVINNSEKGKNYCIGGGKDIRNIDLIKLICKKMDLKLGNNSDSSDLISFVNDRPGHDYRYSINNKLIQNEIGWKPETNLEKGIEKTIDWYLLNKTWMPK